MHVATYTPGYPDKLKTERQWALKGYLPKPGCEGTVYWTNWFFSRHTTYYTDEEVAPATREQLDKYWAPERERRKELRKRRAAREKERKERLTRYNQYLDSIHSAGLLPAIPCSNPSRTIVFDTETTGLNAWDFNDEILQISIIDGEGNILLNSYVKPCLHESWDNATQINGITPEMVRDAPRPEDLIPVVKGIFASADTLIAYNIDFDLGFLDQWEICPAEGQKVIDVMEEFAEVYGEYNEYYGNYKWQKLTTAADYYGYRYDAHDSLEDVRATLYVYRKMRGLEQGYAPTVAKQSIPKVMPP